MSARPQLLLPVLLACAGCLSSSVPEVRRWTVVHQGDASAATAKARPEVAPAPYFSTLRLGPVIVNAPYDKTSFVLHRTDGSVAFDAYNGFAAAPSALLRGITRDNLNEFPKFGRVVSQSSVAAADAQAELLVRDLSLRSPSAPGGALTAHVALTLGIVRTGRPPRAVVLTVDGEAGSEVASDDYSTAFSKAFDQAFRQALDKIDDAAFAIR